MHLRLKVLLVNLRLQVTKSAIIKVLLNESLAKSFETKVLAILYL